jgi:hypothetical protein
MDVGKVGNFRLGYLGLRVQSGVNLCGIEWEHYYNTSVNGVKLIHPTLRLLDLRRGHIYLFSSNYDDIKMT